MSHPRVALLVSTYQRPGHLKRALLSIALQQGVAGKMEVVVTDDGSVDETSDVVDQFAVSVDFPVQFTTHAHNGFQLARCRNEGVATSTAPYLLFLDGDCVLPPDHIAQHLRRRQSGAVVAGDCYRLDEATSERVTEETICSGEFVNWVPWRERRRMATKAFRSRLYNVLRNPLRPRLVGNNIGIWRYDYEQVNGFDETFVGWGLEDTDLQYRLARRGVQFVSIVGQSCTCHLWHPPPPSYVPRARGTTNERRLHRTGRLTRCRDGLAKRCSSDFKLRLVNPEHRFVDRSVIDQFVGGNGPCEVEIVFSPGEGRFSGRAECNLLVLVAEVQPLKGLVKQANVIIPSCNFRGRNHDMRFDCADVEQWLRRVA